MRISTLWSTIAPPLWKIEICSHKLFCRKFNSKQLLFEAFFDGINIYPQCWALKTNSENENQNIWIFILRICLQCSTLGVNIDPIKKSFKQKLFGIKFSKKKSQWEHISISYRSKARALETVAMLKKFENLDLSLIHISEPTRPY